MATITVQLGDNLELLKQYPDNHFNSVCTDAPYGFGQEPDALKVLQDWIDHDYHEVSGTGFMGKKWDAFVPQPIFWKEVFRVLKPGGHLLCFFGTRTYDWGVMAIRLAGFEIRDMITWHYGSGFPKSHNISKAIDKVAGSEREVIGVSSITGGRKSKTMDDENGKDDRSFSNKTSVTNLKTTSTTEDAKKFDGWGTALKPATEPICVARKPLIGTVAETMIEYGTGGINIDSCRIGLEGIENHTTEGKSGLGNNVFGKFKNETKELTEIPRYNSDGRFPSNVIFDDFTADILDEQSGIRKSGSMNKSYEYTNNGFSMGKPTGSTKHLCEASEGGASRFFYVAKPSQDERNAGCEHLSLKDPASVTDFRPTLKSDPEAWAETESAYMRTTARNNNHPTVKPIDLMRYLLRLVTPKGGLSLDPFAGSGTTGCAAEFEEINMVLMDMTPEYIPIINARLAHWKDKANRERYIEGLKNSQTKLF